MAAQKSSASTSDDLLTVCALSVLAFVTADALLEGGHAAAGLLTISPFGMLTAAGWSSSYDNRMVDASGALVCLAAGIVFWLALRGTRQASTRARLFLLLAGAANLFLATGFFFFAGLTDFGDWIEVILGRGTWPVWRIALLAAGAIAWVASFVGVGYSLVRYVGIPRTERRRVWRIALTAWFAAMALCALAAWLNRIGMKYVVLSDLPILVASMTGFLIVPLAIPKRAAPARSGDAVTRSWAWIAVSVVVAVAFLWTLGRGIAITR